MLKKIINFWFCTDKFRYLAAEKVLRMAFDCSGQSLEDINSTKKITYQLFHDRVCDELKKMIGSQIDAKTYEQFENMLLPGKGIPIERYYYSGQQRQRLDNAQNKNKWFSFSLDSVMFPTILHQLFQNDKKGKLKRNDLAQHALCIVGTPGIGKSVKFIATKILLDMRIRHIINGREIKQLSQFSENFKFLYFFVETSELTIMQRILQEVKRDFDNAPQYLSKIQNEQNFQDFMEKVAKLYLKKKIKLRLILDQLNAIYSLTQQRRQGKLDKWIQIRDYFQLPVVMVSSKNNPYLKKYDPIIYFANSTNNHAKHNKIILDNLISPEEKLSYSYSCLVFELQKYSMSRTSITEIIKRVTLPFMTHLSITNSIAKIFAQKSDRSMKKIDQDFKKQKSEQHQEVKQNQGQQEQQKNTENPQSSDNNLSKKIQKENKYQKMEKSKKTKKTEKEQVQQKKQKIIGALNMSFDPNEILKNAKNVMSKTDFSIIDKITQYNLDIIFNFLSFSCQKTSDQKIQIEFKIKDGQNVNTVIKEIVIPKREYSQQNKYEFLAETNFFFEGIRQKKKYIFINTSYKEMENLRMGIMNDLTLEFLQNMRKTNQKQFTNLIKYNASFIFQAFVCNLYKIGLGFQTYFYTILTLKENIIVCKHKVLAEDFFRIEQKESYKLLKKKENQFIKCYAGNQAFDFILTDYDQNKLRLILVDTTISNHPYQIIRKHAQFKKQLFGKDGKSTKTNFKEEIFKLLKQEKTLKLELVCYVLTSVRKQQHLIQSMPDENVIQTGQYYLDKFINDLKNKKMDDKVTITFQTGHFQSLDLSSPSFLIKFEKYTNEQNYQMKNLAGYLFSEHRKVVESEKNQKKKISI